MDACIDYSDIGNSFKSKHDFRTAFSYFIKSFELMMIHNLLPEMGVRINHTSGFHSSLKCAIELVKNDFEELKEWIVIMQRYKIDIDSQIINTIGYTIEESTLSVENKKECFDYVYGKLKKTKPLCI